MGGETDSFSTGSCSRPPVLKRKTTASTSVWITYALMVLSVVGLVGFALFCWQLYDLLDKSDLIQAQTFANDPKNIYQARVLEQGVKYTGSCDDCDMEGDLDRCSEFTVCTVDDKIERECKNEQQLYAPNAAVVQNMSTRRLVGPIGVRRRRSCVDKYLPWAKVRFGSDDAVNVSNIATHDSVTRCAYKFGTETNSQQRSHEGPFVDELKMEPEDMPVWTFHSNDCIVGFHMNLEDFVEFEVMNDRAAWVGIIFGLLMICTVCSLGCALSQDREVKAQYRSLVLCVPSQPGQSSESIHSR